MTLREQVAALDSEVCRDAGVLFKGTTEKEELDKYFSVVSDCGVSRFIKSYTPDSAKSIIPVCVLSYEYSTKNSFGLKMILKESSIHKLNRRYIIFTNKSKLDTYKPFENVENVEIQVVPDEVNSLVLKRQFVLDWAHNNNIDNIFILEDDVGQFSIPVPSTTNSGCQKNIKFIISNNLAFDLWEYQILNNGYKFSGLRTVMAFDMNANERILSHFSYSIKDCVQVIHVSVDTVFNNGVKYDPESGWDDYDFELQYLTKGIKNYSMFMTYYTPPLKSGVSTHNNLEERCKVNTEKLINKWGDLVRVDDRKGLYNAKLNWNKIKKLYSEEDLRDSTPGEIK